MTDVQTAASTRRIRTVQMERDKDTDAQCVLDIREFDESGPSDNTSWTAMIRTSDAAKRAMMLDLSNQIDQMMAGRIDEISIRMMG